MRDSTPQGFTLLELLIGIVVLTVLASIAYPSYRDATIRSRRSDAVKALTQLQQAQERWRSSHPTYSDSLSELNVSSPASGYYTLSIAGADAGTFTATATTSGAQVADARCATLSVALAAGNVTYSSKDSDGHTATNCWSR
ncbi:MAG TPA: type IV pilin protein [Burkholderiaceae bacterium]|nr:type IV pilin protein [Burkholderiaceae bacterium]